MSCVKSQQEITLIGSREPIEKENLVEFRLIYYGELPSSSNAKRRPKEKHAIRRFIHPQLRRLWELKPNLRQLAEQCWIESEERATAINKGLVSELENLDQNRSQSGLRQIGKQWSRVGYELVPLVTPDLALRCSLDIMLLRPSEKCFVFEQGDIDGQLKTLIDGLRIPKTLDEAGGVGPGEDETPLFCLLEDDRLISEVHVTTDELLLLPEHKQVEANDCFAVIHVKLNHREARTFGNYFG